MLSRSSEDVRRTGDGRSARQNAKGTRKAVAREREGGACAAGIATSKMDV